MFIVWIFFYNCLPAPVFSRIESCDYSFHGINTLFNPTNFSNLTRRGKARSVPNFFVFGVKARSVSKCGVKVGMQDTLCFNTFLMMGSDTRVMGHFRDVVRGY